jgi:hypothetical protein
MDKDARAESAQPAAGPKYGVQVTGGRGVVVGDYATVFQVFTQAPRSLSDHIRVRDFAGLVDERTRDFVGREFVFDAIDRVLSDQGGRGGYVVVQGEPGIGKTALLGQLVKTRGYVHHFNVAPMGIRAARTFLANICAQLIVRYRLDHTALPSESTEDGGFLARLLSELAAEPANLPAVVVVDALDEAEDVAHQSGANRLFLPPTLPAGVFFVVSTRPKYNHRLFVQPRWDVYIRDDDPRNLDDVRAYIRGFVDANQPEMGRQIDRWELPMDDFVEVLVRKSEGNFMYLIHVLGDISRGDLSTDVIEDVQGLPEGLRDYYVRHWDTMRSADEQRFIRYQEPVVCLLATAMEPVSLDQVVVWTKRFWELQGWDANRLQARRVLDVVREWREFLNTGEVQGETRFRVYHASFQDFLREEVGLNVYHETIADAALAEIPGFLNNL